MRHSDDYLTARGANPRTGLISPSLTDSPPKTPSTPESPADALKIKAVAKRFSELDHEHQEDSSGQHVPRPVLTRANEGKRVLSNSRWRADEKGWYTEVVRAAPSQAPIARPPVLAARAAAQQLQPSVQQRAGELNAAHSRHVQATDMHPLSSNTNACGTTPPAHTDCTLAQVKAFEHYKRRSRQLSGEGYGQAGQPPLVKALEQQLGQEDGLAKRASVISVGAGPRKFAAASLALKAQVESGACSDVAPKRTATVIQRLDWQGQDQTSQAVHTLPPTQIPILGQFAPYTSPKTPHKTSGERGTVMRAMPGAYRSTSGETIKPVRKTSIPRKPVPSATPSPTANEHRVPSGDQLQHMRVVGRNRSDSLHLGDGISVPKTRTMVPEGPPSIPEQVKGQVSVHVATTGNERKCSLGCPASATGGCSTSQRDASGGALNARWALFDEKNSSSPQRTASSATATYCTSLIQELASINNLFELILTLVLALVRTCLQIRPPNLGLLDAFRDENASPQEKVEALKALLILAGQAIGFAVVMALVLQLCTALKQCLEIVLWPVLLPMRLMARVIGEERH